MIEWYNELNEGAQCVIITLGLLGGTIIILAGANHAEEAGDYIKQLFHNKTKHKLNTAIRHIEELEESIAVTQSYFDNLAKLVSNLSKSWWTDYEKYEELAAVLRKIDKSTHYSVYKSYDHTLSIVTSSGDTYTYSDAEKLITDIKRWRKR